MHPAVAFRCCHWLQLQLIYTVSIPICLLQLLEPLTGNTVKLSSYAAGAPATLVMFIW